MRDGVLEFVLIALRDISTWREIITIVEWGCDESKCEYSDYSLQTLA
jgi:hypothetical protein